MCASYSSSVFRGQGCGDLVGSDRASGITRISGPQGYSKQTISETKEMFASFSHKLLPQLEMSDTTLFQFLKLPRELQSIVLSYTKLPNIKNSCGVVEEQIPAIYRTGSLYLPQR
jgi:hypothetical protein